MKVGGVQEVRSAGAPQGQPLVNCAAAGLVVPNHGAGLAQAGVPPSDGTILCGEQKGGWRGAAVKGNGKVGRSIGADAVRRGDRL